MRRSMAIAAAIAAVSLSGIACASSGTANTNVSEASPDRLTSVEIESVSGATNAYDVVRRLRPRWLQSSGAPASISGGRVTSQVLLVYLDDNRLGTAEALRTLSIGGIKSMRYYDAVRAATVLREIGSEPISGAIVISTR